MKTIHYRIAGLAIGAIASPIAFLTFASSAQAVVLGYWNFNDLSIATATAAPSNANITSYLATSGVGVDTSALLTLGNVTSVSAVGTNANVGITNFAGSTVNALNNDPADEALAIQAGTGTASAANTPNNGATLTFLVNTTGYVNPILTFATRGTSTGFNSNQISYSTDGTNFTNFGAAYTPTTSTTFATQTADFTVVDALDNASSVYLRITLNGATNTAGNNRFDNIQINAEPVPEPITILGGLTALGMGGAIKRKLRGEKKVEA